MQAVQASDYLASDHLAVRRLPDFKSLVNRGKEKVEEFVEDAPQEVKDTVHAAEAAVENAARESGIGEAELPDGIELPSSPPEVTEKEVGGDGNETAIVSPATNDTLKVETESERPQLESPFAEKQNSTQVSVLGDVVANQTDAGPKESGSASVADGELSSPALEQGKTLNGTGVVVPEEGGSAVDTETQTEPGTVALEGGQDDQVSSSPSPSPSSPVSEGEETPPEASASASDTSSVSGPTESPEEEAEPAPATAEETAGGGVSNQTTLKSPTANSTVVAPEPLTEEEKQTPPVSSEEVGAVQEEEETKKEEENEGPPQSVGTEMSMGSESESEAQPKKNETAAVIAPLIGAGGAAAAGAMGGGGGDSLSFPSTPPDLVNEPEPEESFPEPASPSPSASLPSSDSPEEGSPFLPASPSPSPPLGETDPDGFLAPSPTPAVKTYTESPRPAAVPSYASDPSVSGGMGGREKVDAASSVPAFGAPVKSGGSSHSSPSSVRIDPSPSEPVETEISFFHKYASVLSILVISGFVVTVYCCCFRERVSAVLADPTGAGRTEGEMEMVVGKMTGESADGRKGRDRQGISKLPYRPLGAGGNSGRAGSAGNTRDSGATVPGTESDDGGDHLDDDGEVSDEERPSVSISAGGRGRTNDLGTAKRETGSAVPSASRLGATRIGPGGLGGGEGSPRRGSDGWDIEDDNW
uniref:Uncharacterized protein n=1 Tax=Chromera velia CCMP2878 TaxID=1169474 RepID=A0A0G4HN90_9ALVE|eukprot:Cvel_29410.t1-p1 / transcript=Cvel_29410.t1 / gene=Cvel_29410 / organism=Chromera_velia_CCMP2878 / gene_product=hypothetical protein / transcript_product=hypothetical protein / location=Cvel_scaffold4013:2260-4356(+) / protein_length=699 / sequence_SO=supercontig / SO=protein_coding / is_pseudo=false